jgi:hypothetical protein
MVTGLIASSAGHPQMHGVFGTLAKLYPIVFSECQLRQVYLMVNGQDLLQSLACALHNKQCDRVLANLPQSSSRNQT